MIGIVVNGRTYDRETYEISLNPISAKVIDIGMSPVRIWPNGFTSSVFVSVDFLICAPATGNTFSTTEVVRIPFYLLTKIIGATVNNSIASLVTGKNTNFYTNDRNNFSLNLYPEIGGIITKAKCPKIIWDENTPYISFSDYYVCYPTPTDFPPVFDLNNLIFIDLLSSSFISPNYGVTPGVGGA